MSTTQFYERQWRVSADPGDDSEEPEWRTLPRLSVDTNLLEFPELELGVRHDLRWRIVDERGGFGDWSRALGVVPGGSEIPPPAPDRIDVVDGGCLSWYAPLDPYLLAGWEVFHALGHERTLERMQKAHTGLVAGAPFSLCEVPGGLRTFAVRAVDTSGTAGEPAFLTTRVRPLDDALDVTLRTQSEGPTWPGLKGGAQVQGNALPADPVGTTPFHLAAIEPFVSVDQDAEPWPDDDAPFWSPLFGYGCKFKSDVDVSCWATAYHWIEYVADFVVHAQDEGPGTRITLDVDATSPNGSVLLRYRVMHDSRPFRAPNASGSGWPALAFEGGIGNEPWRPWPGQIDAPRAGTYRLCVLVPGGWDQPTLNAMTIRLSARERAETSLVSVPVGGTRVPSPDPMRCVTAVEVVPFGETTGRPLVHDTRPRNGPWIDLLDDSGQSTAGTVLVRVRGA